MQGCPAWPMAVAAPPNCNRSCHFLPDGDADAAQVQDLGQHHAQRQGPRFTKRACACARRPFLKPCRTSSSERRHCSSSRRARRQCSLPRTLQPETLVDKGTREEASLPSRSSEVAARGLDIKGRPGSLSWLCSACFCRCDPRPELGRVW